ncbi:MAG: shikimate dehydrogenase, partial [Streptococcus sanguinis]|nr:shikimate dehydrogenase [Streptococcus sanguinis]
FKSLPSFAIRGKKMTILGAGGAATAIIAQAALDQAEEIFIFTRQASYEKIVSKMAAISHQTKSRIQVLTLEDADSLQDKINQSDLLVNGTSLGMDGINMPLPEQLELPSQIIVVDVIYQPFETPFIKWAGNQNVTAVNGLGMLLYQGAEAFELWTGKPMPSQEIWQCLEELYK